MTKVPLSLIDQGEEFLLQKGLVTVCGEFFGNRPHKYAL